jgi:hypothetical protein
MGSEDQKKRAHKGLNLAQGESILSLYKIIPVRPRLFKFRFWEITPEALGYQL